MRKHVALFVVLCFSAFMFQTTGAFAAEPQYYVVGSDPVQPDRTLQSGECMGKWNFPIPGQMGTKTGFKGDKSLAPLTPLIFPISQNGSMIPQRQELVIYSCGNGFKPLAPLDTVRAVSVECYQAEPQPQMILPDAPYNSAQPSTAELERQVSPRKSHKGWWVVGAIVIAGIVLAASGHGNSRGHGPAGPPPIQ
jgi:hypothetical protein